MSMIDRCALLSARLLSLLPVVCLAVGPFLCVEPLSAADEEGPVSPEQEWMSLFDGKTLGKWEVVEKYDFKRHGKVHIEEGAVVLDMGSPATGIRWKGDFPKSAYEISLEARRVAGSDFFCGVTFPVGDAALTLVCGGWSGMVVGLSSIDGEPAVENETCTYKEFDLGRWYPIRLRVTKPLVEVWLDGEKIIELPTIDRKFSLYWEMEPLQPLGICSWVTTGALRKIRFRRVKEEPSVGAPFEDAVSVWHMADDQDSAGKGGHLVPDGNVQLGEELVGIYRKASLRRGGDGMAARCRGGRLAAGGETRSEANLWRDAMTVAIRLRDPSGSWNSVLLAKQDDDERPILNIYAADSGSGMELVLELSTATGKESVRLTIPVAEIGPTGWHDVIARYDGAKVELFVDGRVVAEKPARGNLPRADSQPWVIGDTSNTRPPDDGFHGLIDHAAVWYRALSDDEIELISGGKEEILQKKRLAQERRARARRESGEP
jgi:concanavalin A-like lectin/glucanase superfamily protein/3-keto-disaccharide hydrolase